MPAGRRRETGARPGQAAPGDLVVHDERGERLDWAVELCHARILRQHAYRHADGRDDRPRRYQKPTTRARSAGVGGNNPGVGLSGADRSSADRLGAPLARAAADRDRACAALRVLGLALPRIPARWDPGPLRPRVGRLWPWLPSWSACASAPTATRSRHGSTHEPPTSP